MARRSSHGIYGNCRFHCRVDLLSVSAAQVENLCCFHVCLHQSGGGNPLKRLLLSEEITMAKVGGMLLILVSVFVIQREDWLSGLLTRKVKRIAD